jgi:hypothetical protein
MIITVDIESNLTFFSNPIRQVDIATDCWIDGAYPFFVRAGLSPGDAVLGGGLTTIINDTTQHFGRDAAHVGVVSDSQISDVYWDREKGVLLELSGGDPHDASAYSSLKMVATNMWTSAPSFLGNGDLLWAALVIALIAVFVITAIVLMRRGKKVPLTATGPFSQNPPPAPPPPPPP